MEKNFLEGVYREEFIRAKARKDYNDSINKKPKEDLKRYSKLISALISILFGGFAFYALFYVYNVFI